MSLADLLYHPDPGVRGTVVAMFQAMRAAKPVYDATLAHDAAHPTILNGEPDSWRIPTGDTRGGVFTYDPCSWRDAQDPHCMCWRCGSQGIELMLARCIAFPCADARSDAGCFTCGDANDPDAYAYGIVLHAQRIADAHREGRAKAKPGPVWGSKPAPRRVDPDERPANDTQLPLFGGAP